MDVFDFDEGSQGVYGEVTQELNLVLCKCVLRRRKSLSHQRLPVVLVGESLGWCLH